MVPRCSGVCIGAKKSAAGKVALLLWPSTRRTSGIACGVTGTPDAQGWVIALGDMPCIPMVLIQAVVTGLERGSDIIAPVYNKRRGHPVGFSARHSQALKQLHTDEGARSIIQANSGSVDLIETTECGVIVDFDIPGK